MLIHLGSSDVITYLSSKKFIQEIHYILLCYNALLPDFGHIVYLVDRWWHGAFLNSGKKTEKKRKRINKVLSKEVTELGGSVTCILHSNISVINTELFNVREQGLSK